MNLKLYAAALAVIAALCICFVCFAGENDAAADLLRSYGYDVSDKPIEQAEIRIPKPLDMVYQGYNEIQKRAGFDLEPYEGKKGMRYTYAVRNYPGGIDGVRANVVVIDGEIVGGDICTVRIDGFMHELKRMAK